MIQRCKTSYKNSSQNNNNTLTAKACNINNRTLEAPKTYLVDKFSQFFVDKVRRIRDNISTALQQQSSRVFAARQHTGPELSAFQPATIDEVRKLLTSMPRKTSPLDVLPVFTTEGLCGRLCTGRHDTCQPVTANRAVSRTF